MFHLLMGYSWWVDVAVLAASALVVGYASKWGWFQ